MTLLPLTPLTHIPEFTEPIREILAQYWITSAEEFAATSRLDNVKYGDGLAAMGAELALSAEAMEQLYDVAIAAAPRASDYTALVELDVSTGLIFEELPLPSGLDFAPPSDLPPEVLLPHSLPVLDQGARGTCVAFTMVAMLQILAGASTDLSEQFLFWACKQLDGIPNNSQGTTPQAAIDALKKFGICLETEWSYNPHPIIGNVGQGPPPTAAMTAALARRIHSGGALESPKSAAVCTALAEGKPVLIGMPVYPFWTASGQVRRGGRVRRPLPGEQQRGGHAICAVGYREDTTAPGGGYIIFRNSWGIDFGSENLDRSGYGYIPYEVVDTENRCAYVID